MHRIVGHGLTVTYDFLLTDGVTVSPTLLRPEMPTEPASAHEFREAAAIIAMEPLASFSLLIEEPRGADKLAAKAWNSLWTFNLLALACQSPVISLYGGPADGSRLDIANRNLVINPVPHLIEASAEQLEWAGAHYKTFYDLIDNLRFQTSMRYFHNAHYLFDYDARLMLLWAGIEGLLNVEGELRRRIALHAAMLFDGTADEKAAHFANVKKAYDIRSKVVHGTGADRASLRLAYEFASYVLARLLRKMVELGRVPSAAELDEMAAGIEVS